MTDWFEGRLADACASIDYGLTASAALTPVGPKFLRITDIVGGSLDWDSVPFVETDDQSTQKHRLNHLDIVIARTGATTGVSRFISDPPTAVFASYLVRLSIKPNFDPRFIGYWLKSPAFWGYLKGVLGDKSAQPNASASTMTNAPMRVPAALAEQRAIAATLGALDDKIELNRKLNATLEAMARALFRDWFVDFGPTRAKMAGGKPYLSPDLWSLFPDRLDSDGKPEGWETGTLGTVAMARSQGVSPSDFDADTPYIGLEHMPRGSIALAEWDGANKVSSNKATFKAGDFLFGKLRPYFHKVGIAPVSGICSTDIVVLRPKVEDWSGFVIACISDADFVAYTDKTSTGTKMPRTSWSIMAKYPLILPTHAVAEAFNESVAPILAKIRANIHESRTLARTRDLLLPPLMSGELRVAGAETLVSKVA